MHKWNTKQGQFSNTSYTIKYIRLEIKSLSNLRSNCSRQAAIIYKVLVSTGFCSDTFNSFFSVQEDLKKHCEESAAATSWLLNSSVFFAAISCAIDCRSRRRSFPCIFFVVFWLNILRTCFCRLAIVSEPNVGHLRCHRLLMSCHRLHTIWTAPAITAPNPKLDQHTVWNAALKVDCWCSKSQCMCVCRSSVLAVARPEVFQWGGGSQWGSGVEPPVESRA